MSDQKKQRKYGRIKNSESHKRALMDNRTAKNKLKREISNLKKNPNDVACLSRLSTMQSTRAAPVGMWDDLDAALKLARESFKA